MSWCGQSRRADTLLLVPRFLADKRTYFLIRAYARSPHGVALSFRNAINAGFFAVYVPLVNRASSAFYTCILCLIFPDTLQGEPGLAARCV